MTVLSSRPIASSEAFVVLATYNGAAFVREQIESIRRQSFADWTLLIGDDGSTDGTQQIVRQIAATDERLHLAEDTGSRLGPLGNFGRLAQRAYDLGARYVFFADQDDVWFPDKLTKQLARMREAEGARSTSSPHLVYSDLTVVDEHLQVVHPSFLQHSRLYHEAREPWKTLVGRNFVLGCACLVNRPLLEFALPFPEAAVMHDWWLNLAAACVGEISSVSEPLVYYRRHGGNTSGPTGFWSGLNPLRYSWKKRWQAGTASFRQSLAQVQALCQRLEERQPNLAPELRVGLDRCCRALTNSRSRFRALHQLWRMGVPQIDVPRRALYYLCLLLSGHQSPLSMVTSPRSRPDPFAEVETSGSCLPTSDAESG